MKIYRQNSTTKRIFAGLLAVWMSNIVFLFCCETPKAQATEVESCPLAKKGHCHKSASGTSSKDENALQLESFQNNDSAFDCYRFLPRFFDKVRKVEKGEQIIVAANTKPEVKSLSLAFIKNRPIAFSNYHPRPLSGSGTYLKNRVFRI